MNTNRVIIMGIVVEKPIIKYVAEIGKSVYVKLKIDRKDIGKTETITVSTSVEEVMKNVLLNVKPGDLFFSGSAKISTFIYDKNIEIVCPHCQEVTYINTRAERTDIIFTDFELIKNPQPTAFGYNKVYLLGRICSDLNYRQNLTRPGAKSYIKYKLAVDRAGKYKEQQDADYPFIVSFGKEADTASQHLKTSDLVLVEGSVQEREIKQKVSNTCSVCGNTINTRKDSFVREIITSNVKYLDKLLKKEQTEDSEEKPEE